MSTAEKRAPGHQIGTPAWNKGKGAAVTWLREHVGYSGAECLIWPFSRHPRGYGQLGHLGKPGYAHRVMCELANGPAPTPGHLATHDCGRGHDGCVNPKHLSWKTLSGNMQDKHRHGTTTDSWWGQNGKLTPEQVAEIMATPMGLHVIPQLAARFGVTESNIRHIRTGRTWAPGSQRPSNLTPEQVAEIRAARGHLTQRELAADYGVSPYCIYRIQKGRTFKGRRPAHSSADGTEK
jgi:hypothetical protein